MSGRSALFVLFAASIAAAQQDASKPAERAQALVQELARPERRLDAARELTALGPAALPALHRALVDARPEVVRGALFAAPGLAADIASLRDPIRRCLAHKDLGVALAARAALPALDFPGATLFTDYPAGRVARFGGDEQELHSGLPMVMSAQELDDGRRLVAAYGDNRVVEFARDGSLVWTFAELESPSDAERLPDGNTLIADTGHSRVLEVDRQGAIVWCYENDVRPIDVDRLGNGNTLIASYQKGGVVEVDPAGKVVWQWRAENVRDADRLLDGTTLLTDTAGRCVLRVDAEHRKLRTWALDFAANDAELLPNGHLVVGGEGALVEFDHAGVEVWRHKVGYVGRLARHGTAPR